MKEIAVFYREIGCQSSVQFEHKLPCRVSRYRTGNDSFSSFSRLFLRNANVIINLQPVASNRWTRMCTSKLDRNDRWVMVRPSIINTISVRCATKFSINLTVHLSLPVYFIFTSAWCIDQFIYCWINPSFIITAAYRRSHSILRDYQPGQFYLAQGCECLSPFPLVYRRCY